MIRWCVELNVRDGQTFVWTPMLRQGGRPWLFRYEMAAQEYRDKLARQQPHVETRVVQRDSSLR
jgi:hypothetical protein